MFKTLIGKVHGKTIVLAEDHGLAEGQEVEIRVKIDPPGPDPGDGLSGSAGDIADYWTEEDDRILEQIYQDRKNDTRREIFE